MSYKTLKIYSPMNWLKIIIFLQILLFSSQLTAQNKQLEKANKRYQIKKYAEAIPLYEQGLKKNPNLSAKVRLANCYRINNNIEKAVKLYSEVVLHKRAKPVTWYHYGEALMSQGKYDDAKVWLAKYTDKKPGDPKGWTLLESIDQLKTIEPYYIVSNVKPFAHNSESDDSAPVFFRDGIAFSSDRKTGAKIMKRKSSFTGRDFLSIYLSKGNGDGTFKSPNQISERINDLNKNAGTIAISPDGTFVVFSRNSDVSNRKNQYNLMLYGADVTEDGRIRNVNLMKFCKNNANHMHPTFSPDGKTIFFTSDKSGVGGTDIFYSTLSEKGWSRAKNLDAPVNTTANEGFPFMSSDNKLFFCSKGHTSYGGFDIFVTQQDIKGNWSHPSNIGSPINSPADDISIYLSKDLEKGMFASSREGGDDDIYLFDIDGMFERLSVNMIVEAPATEKILASNSEDETIVLEPIEEVSEEYPSDGFEIKIKTLNEINETSQNTFSGNNDKVITPNEKEEELAYHSSKKDDLPFVAFVPVYLKNDNENSTKILEEISTVPSEKTDLPFMPMEPFNSETETAKNNDEYPQNKNIFEETDKNPSSKFQEGLASIDSPLDDVRSEPVENKSDENIAEMREFLTLQTPQDETVFILEKIKFETNKYMVTNGISNRLDQLVILMNEFPEINIEVNTYTESIGDDRENMVFSIKRATAIAGYLIRRGIGTDRVKVMGYGETQLLNHCANGVTCSPEDHAINQRVELKILNQ